MIDVGAVQNCWIDRDITQVANATLAWCKSQQIITTTATTMLTLVCQLNNTARCSSQKQNTVTAKNPYTATGPKFTAHDYYGAMRSAPTLQSEAMTS
jgi:hypothetical protein